MGSYGTNSLQNGRVTGYSANLNNSLIVKNIMMNDDRNNTEYRCVIMTTQGATAIIIRQSDPSILYVAGEYEYSRCDVHIGVQSFHKSEHPQINRYHIMLVCWCV